MNHYLTFERQSTAAHQYTGVMKELSERQQEVMKLLALGWTAAQIARHIHVSDSTVGKYREIILAKMGFADTRDLVQYAWRKGVVS